MRVEHYELSGNVHKQEEVNYDNWNSQVECSLRAGCRNVDERNRSRTESRSIGNVSSIGTLNH